MLFIAHGADVVTVERAQSETTIEEETPAANDRRTGTVLKDSTTCEEETLATNDMQPTTPCEGNRK